MTRTTASLVGSGVLVLLLMTLLGCSGDGDGGGSVFSGSGCNDDQKCSGSYSGAYVGNRGSSGFPGTIKGTVAGDAISFSRFAVVCGPGFSCSYAVTGLNDTATFSDTCEMALTAQNGSVILTIEGSLDRDTCHVTGTYDLDAGTCCNEGGRWGADK